MCQKFFQLFIITNEIFESRGLETDRGLNAAKNVKQTGLKEVLGRGTPKSLLWAK